MKLVLKSFSEDVSLDGKSTSKSFLVFDGDGEELRVPASREAISTIARFLHRTGRTPQAEVEEEVQEEAPAEETSEVEEQTHPEEAESFGGDADEEDLDAPLPEEMRATKKANVDEQDEEEEDPISKFELPKVERAAPASEEDVPSL